MKKLAFFLGLAIAIFVSAQVVQATQVIDDALQVNSLKVGQQGVGGVTYFNGTIINETIGENDANNPVTFGDNVRIDGRVYRGATAGPTDSLPFFINDNVEVAGSLTSDSFNTGVLTASTLNATTSITTDTLTAATVTATSLSAGSINLTTLDNLGCIEGEIAYYGTDGWECTPDYSVSIISFIVCLDTLIAGDSNITVVDWNACYAETFE
ncbi:hypothetical protein KKI23_03765 [Patescibacteria group bacterium]|nr:hypothetical protein [Patescibacteria group bacterium]